MDRGGSTTIECSPDLLGSQLILPPSRANIVAMLAAEIEAVASPLVRRDHLPIVAHRSERSIGSAKNNHVN
jgi:hypothetical protein